MDVGVLQQLAAPLHRHQHQHLVSAGACSFFQCHSDASDMSMGGRMCESGGSRVSVNCVIFNYSHLNSCCWIWLCTIVDHVSFYVLVFDLGGWEPLVSVNCISSRLLFLVPIESSLVHAGAHLHDTTWFFSEISCDVIFFCLSNLTSLVRWAENSEARQYTTKPTDSISSCHCTYHSLISWMCSLEDWFWRFCSLCTHFTAFWSSQP